MRTASVADLRNDFRRVAAWLTQGEEVEIRRRGKPFARLTPLAKQSGAPANIDFAAQLRAIWGSRVFSANEFKLMRDFEREGEEG
ncbi:MAG TPA: prevent-host-death protein [Planctomycetota bacterium]|nr:prevent-host-death protein [Planctomycetota bacterium]